MRRLLQHIVTYATVNAFLIAVWVMTSGSIAKLQAIGKDPASALNANFWPVWPILGWGTFLVIHAATAITNLATGNTSARRRRRQARRAARDRKETMQGVASTGTGIVADVAAAGTGLVREISNAVDQAKKRKEAVTPPAPSEGGPQRRWVTVLFTDISESTKHNEDLGDEEWHRIIARVRAIIRAALAVRGGTEVGTQGDGMLARFSSPADAVLCAIDIQSELLNARAESGFIPGVRIGVHAGEAVHDEGDLIGRVINLASRVMDEAEPGEIFVTEPVADQLVGKLELEDKGLRPLKGVSQPRHLLAVKWSDAPS